MAAATGAGAGPQGVSAPSGTAGRAGGPGAALRAVAAAMLLAQANPAAAQTPLSVPGAAEAALPGTSEYAVSLVAGRAYRFLLSSTAFDPMLELVGPSGAKLAEDDDSGGGLAAQIVHVAGSSGVYRLRVRPAGGGSATGRFVLAVAETEVPQPPRAVPLRIGQAVEGALGGAQPEMLVYRLRLEAGQVLTATMDVVGSGIDPLLELRSASAAADSQPLARDDDGGGELNARLSYIVREAGDYHLYARQVGRAEGRFRLNSSVATGRPKPVATLSPGREERHSLLVATSAAVDDGAPAARLLHRYRLSGRAGEAMTLNLRSSAFDALLEVVGDSILGRTVLARDDDGGGGTDAQLAIRFVADGDVEVRAISLNEREGDYVLSVSAAPR